MKTGGLKLPAPVGVKNIFEQGMTLRDYFAGQALIATLTNSFNLFNEGGFPDDADLDDIYSDAAATAYLVADEMLRWRKK